MLKGGDETIDVECDVWNLSSVLLLGKSFSSFLRNLFSLENMFSKNFDQPNMENLKDTFLETVFLHTKHTQELPIKSCNPTFLE